MTATRSEIKNHAASSPARLLNQSRPHSAKRAGEDAGAPRSQPLDKPEFEQECGEGWMRAADAGAKNARLQRDGLASFHTEIKGTFFNLYGTLLVYDALDRSRQTGGRQP
jgi:hypothetical protein